MIFIRTCLFLIFLLHVLIAWGQNPLYKRFSTSDGLAKQSIYDVYQDAGGLIWLGTDEGLVRFDGRTFQKFSAPEKYRKGITNILETNQGKIYCQNFAGQVFVTHSVYDSLQYVPEIQGVGRFMQNVIINGHTIGFCGNDYIGFFDTHNRQLTRIPFPTSSAQISVFNRNDESLKIHNNQTREFFHISENGDIRKSTFENSASVLFHLSINTEDYLISKLYPFEVTRISNGKKSTLDGLLRETLINHISSISHDHIGVFTTNGVYIYDTNLKLIWHWFEEESISGGIKDFQNNYWFSTLQNGLILVTQPNARIALEQENLTCIASKKNNIIVGTADNGILEIEGMKTKIIHYQDPTNHAMRELYYNEATDELLFSNQFFHILSNGKNVTKEISVNEISPLNTSAYLLAEATTVSIYSKNERETIAQPYYHSFQTRINNRFLLSDRTLRTEHAKQIDSQNFLISTTDGLLKLTPQGSTELLFNNNKIYALGLCKADGDSILIATQTNGILLYHKDKVEEYIPKSSLFQGNIKQLKLYKNLLYLLYSNALEVFTPNKKRIQSFLTSDGWNGYNLTDFEIKGDTTFITTDKGLIAVTLTNAAYNDAPPVLRILNSKVNQLPIDFNQTYELKAGQNLIEIDFAILDFKGLQTTKGYYSINDGDWIKANGNKIILTSLAPGDYKIKIKAVNARGVSSTVPLEINFTILTPWFWSWWFMTLSVLAILTSIVLFYKIRLGNAEKANQLLNEKIVLEKALHQSTLTSIKSQMNPHFIFNALNTIQSYIYTNDKRAASDYLVDFSELTRLILDMSNKESVVLSDEIKANSLYLRLEKMRFEDDFEYEIITNDIDTDAIRIPSMLIQPYVENAVKHGLLHKKSDKKLKLIFAEKLGILLVDIIDNGIGIEAARQINNQRQKTHQSFALQANKKRFEILNTGLSQPIGEEIISLFDERGNAAGTLVKLKIPFSLNKS